METEITEIIMVLNRIAGAISTVGIVIAVIGLALVISISLHK